MKLRNLGLFVFFAIGGVCLGPPLINGVVVPIMYGQHRRSAAELIDRLRHSQPANVSPAAWECASTWAGIAFHNVCFSQEHVSLTELDRFTKDLEEKLDTETAVDLKTVDWLWDRLKATGPHGKRYVERFEPQYRESMQALHAF